MRHGGLRNRRFVADRPDADAVIKGVTLRNMNPLGRKILFRLLQPHENREPRVVRERFENIDGIHGEHYIYVYRYVN